MPRTSEDHVRSNDRRDGVVPSSSAPRPPRVLSIAGSDPSGGAGIQADLKSIAANGGYGMAAITALTAQNTLGVRGIHEPPAAFLAAQLDAVSDDVEIDAVKIGMLFSASIVAEVAAWLDRARPGFVVLDPVMVATSGDRLIAADAEDAVRGLLDRVDLVTPNVPELAVLSRSEPASTWPEALEQARALSLEHGVAVLAKGGHLAGDESRDALVDAAGSLDPAGRPSTVEFPGPRIDTRATHGTGCSLSSAVATRAAAAGRGGDLVAGIREAKHWLTESLEHGDELAVGSGAGPVSHFAGLWARGGTTTRPSARAVAADWWARIEEIRRGIDELDFIRSLRDGSLDGDAFRWYLTQDAIYLGVYSRALATASSLAPTREQQAFWATGAFGAVAAEIELHERWIEPGAVDRTPPSRTTLEYTNHLVAAGAHGDYAVAIAALLPCYWLYTDIGRRLLAVTGEEHPYADWISTYGDPEFAAATDRAVEIVTEVAATADDETRERMFRAFEWSSRHELWFFEAPALAVAATAEGSSATSSRTEADATVGALD